MMICIVASPSQDSKQISSLAINMPHLLRFAQTGINQQDTSQQSPLLLYSTLIRIIHIKMTRTMRIPYMNTLWTMRKTYQSHTPILKRILKRNKNRIGFYSHSKRSYLDATSYSDSKHYNLQSSTYVID